MSDNRLMPKRCRRISLIGTVRILCTVSLGTVSLCTTSLLAQAKTAPKSNNNKPLTLVGCVQRNETTPDQFTLFDPEDGAIYRLTGIKVGDFLGRRVQIVGGFPSKRLVIAGGLTPSANAAAQAGAIDQTRAANAAAAAPGGPGAVQLPEFRVKSVRPVTGTCPG